MKKYTIFLSLMFMVSLALGQATDTSGTKDLKTDSMAQGENTPDNAAPAKTGSTSKTTKSSSAKTDSVKAAAKIPMSKVDSLNLANARLEEQMDSLSTEMARYQILYNAIKVKVLKQDFNPVRMADIIDSLAVQKDSTFIGLKSSVSYLRDSISALNSEISRLNDKYGENAPIDATKAKLARELKQLKELLDLKVLTQSEFDIKKTMILQKWQ